MRLLHMNLFIKDCLRKYKNIATVLSVLSILQGNIPLYIEQLLGILNEIQVLDVPQTCPDPGDHPSLSVLCLLPETVCDTP